MASRWTRAVTRIEMRDHKTLILFASGNALVTSPSGDRYWIQSEDGETLTPCSLQQAAMMWREYEKETSAVMMALEELEGLFFDLPSAEPSEARPDTDPAEMAQLGPETG
jgi:hypothetical protein